MKKLSMMFVAALMLVGGLPVASEAQCPTIPTITATEPCPEGDDMTPSRYSIPPHKDHPGTLVSGLKRKEYVFELPACSGDARAKYKELYNNGPHGPITDDQLNRYIGNIVANYNKFIVVYGPKTESFQYSCEGGVLNCDNGVYLHAKCGLRAAYPTDPKPEDETEDNGDGDGRITTVTTTITTTTSNNEDNSGGSPNNNRGGSSSTGGSSGGDTGGSPDPKKPDSGPGDAQISEGEDNVFRFSEFIYRWSVPMDAEDNYIVGTFVLINPPKGSIWFSAQQATEADTTDGRSVSYIPERLPKGLFSIYLPSYELAIDDKFMVDDLPLMLAVEAFSNSSEDRARAFVVISLEEDGSGKATTANVESSSWGQIKALMRVE